MASEGNVGARIYMRNVARGVLAQRGAWCSAAPQGLALKIHVKILPNKLRAVIRCSNSRRYIFKTGMRYNYE